MWDAGFAPSISDHFPGAAFDRVRGFDAYLAAIDATADELDVPILAALEIDLADPSARIPVAVLARLDHLVAGWHVAPPHGADTGGRVAYASFVLDELDRRLLDHPIDVLAHAGRYLAPPGEELPDWWIGSLVDILAREGVALEINGKTAHASDALLRRARDAGVAISLGSDLHGAADAATHVSRLRATMKRLGLAESDLFDARVSKELRPSAARWARVTLKDAA
jgi:histidinol phosphatase-like PHP family hydrolase